MLSVQSPDILIVKRIWTSYVEFTLYKLIVIIKFRWTVTSQDRSSTPPQCYTIHNTNSELGLNGLVRKLETSGTINEYNAVILEQLVQGVLEHAPSTVEGQEFYIPHKGVVRKKAKSTKLLIVYDASTLARDGAPSLNECLNTGPTLQNQLWNVLVRGRFNLVAITGDIKMAFLQI